MSSWIPYLAALMAAKVRAFPRRAVAERAISQKVVASEGLMMTLPEATRTPQSSPKPSSFLASMGDSIRTGEALGSSTTSQNAKAKADDNAPWTVVPSWRARCRSRLVSSVVSDKPFLRGRVSSLVTKTAGLSGEEGGADPGSLKSAPVTQSGGSTNLGSHHKVGRTTLVEEPEKLFQCS
jgi:hypothetical protein